MSGLNILKRTRSIVRGQPKAKARNVDKYEHPDKKRLNNPPVGLVTPETDLDQPKRSGASTRSAKAAGGG